VGSYRARRGPDSTGRDAGRKALVTETPAFVADLTSFGSRGGAPAALAGARERTRVARDDCGVVRTTDRPADPKGVCALSATPYPGAGTLWESPRPPGSRCAGSAISSAPAFRMVETLTST
jgi:hypothetical protein